MLAAAARDRNDARRALVETFGFTDADAEGVLDLTFADLTRFARQRARVAEADDAAVNGGSVNGRVGQRSDEELWRSRLERFTPNEYPADEREAWRRWIADGAANGWLTIARLDRPFVPRFLGPAGTGRSSETVLLHEVDAGKPVQVRTRTHLLAPLTDDNLVEELSVRIDLEDLQLYEEIDRDGERCDPTVTFDGEPYRGRELTYGDWWAVGFSLDPTTHVICSGCGHRPDLAFVRCTDLAVPAL
ncbi:MAG: hypothetical protein S0880_30325 [Actinomycetota bacterium]|nr:hypothetical protein [Actinomycetota bacterium]